MPPANTACDLDPKESDIGVCDGDTAHKLHLPRSASANSALLVRSLIDSSPGPRNEPEEGTKLVQSRNETIENCDDIRDAVVDPQVSSG